MEISNEQPGCEPSIEETVDDLLQTLVETGRSVSLAIATNSMWPVLRPGDRAVVQAARAEELRPGDIVVVRVGNVRLIHRLIRRIGQSGQVLLVTKGDNCVEGDKPWPAARLLGVVVAVERQGSRLNLRSARARAIGAAAALLSRGQWRAHRSLRGMPRRVLCRGLGVLIAGMSLLSARA